jgi:hypothetical protein
MTVPEYDWTSGHSQMSDYWPGPVNHLIAASFTLEIYSQLSTGHYFNQATLCCYVLVTFTLYVLRLMFESLHYLKMQYFQRTLQLALLQ